MSTPATSRRLKIALAGLGESGMYFLERLLLRDDCLVVGGADPATGRREHARPMLPNCRSTPEAFLHDPEVDVLWITGAPPNGPELAVAALQSGKQVVIEPRSVGDSGRCRQLAALSKTTGRAILAIMPRRFDEDFLAACAVVDSGELGLLVSLERTVWQLSPVWAEGRDGSLDERADLAHFDEVLFSLLDQANRLVGRPGQRVWCQQDSRPAANGAGQTRLLVDFGAETTVWLNQSGRTPANLDTGWRVQGRLGSFVGGVQSTATQAGELIDVPIPSVPYRGAEPVESIVRYFGGETDGALELQRVLPAFLLLEAGRRSAISGEMIPVESGHGPVAG